MRIIIAGAGDVGFHLAKLLTYEEQDITIVDLNAERLKYIANHLDVSTIKGSATSFHVLTSAGISKADLFISVTESEETNISTCTIAKQLGAKRTIARISNTEFLHKRDFLDLKTIGIDEIISPESLAAREIKRLLRESVITDSFDFEKGSLTLLGISINEECKLKNQSIIDAAQLNPKNNYTTVAILRDGETIIPNGQSEFKENDHAYFIAQPDGVDDIIKLTGKERVSIKNIMILGGSRIGINTAKRLSKKYNIKIIESDKVKCFEMADMLPDTLIINGDGRDVELMEEENIEGMDAFIAVTGNSETNIISSLVAKKHGVKKTIALVENMDYIHLSQDIGVDTMINKKLIAANFIFRYIRKGEVVSLTSIHGVDAEILEFEVKEASKILDNELKNLDLPKTAVVGGVIRKGRGMSVRGNFKFEPKDRVVILSKPECIHKIEAFFK